MDAEIEGYRRQIQSLLDRVCACLEGLSAAQLNWRPPMHGANSAYVIAAHIACGRPIERDRPAEFEASGPDAAGLRAQAQRLSDDIDAALAALAPSALDQRLLPAKSLWGEGEPREISVRQALLEVVEHASIHLGQLQITRDLALQESRA
jgi:hypothetical protein